MYLLLIPVRKPIQIRSSSSNLRFGPSVNANIEPRDFCVVVRTFWDRLPCSLRSVEHTAKFRLHRKTFIYNLTSFVQVHKFAKHPRAILN